MTEPHFIHAPASKQAPAPEKSSSKRRAKPGLIGAAAIMALAGTAWLAYHLLVGRYHEETNDAFLQSDTVTIAPKLSGYVLAVLVKDNQHVQAGQPLVRIDPRDYRAQADQYQAQIAIARANADAVRAQIDEQASVVEQARIQLQTAQTSAAFTAAEARRYEPLAEIGAETSEQLATRRNQAQQSAQQVGIQRAALANVEKRVASLRAQVRQAEAQAASAEAQLKAAKVNVASTTLVAAAAGRIGDRTAREGQFVQPGTRLMSLVPSNSLYIVANFKETQMRRMRVGQDAEITIDALPDQVFHGHVESIAPGTGAQFSLLPPQNATGNFTKIVQRVPVRIALDTDANARQVLVAGLSAKVEIATAEDRQ